MTRPIFLLTDFGTADAYVGIVKAVILSIAPDARIVDLTHEIPPQDVRAGAYALLTAAPYLPEDAIVLAVVDPGVGTARRPIAGQAGGTTFIGPANGLRSWARDSVRSRARGAPGWRGGGGYTAVILDRPRFWLPSVSATFHGRDIFGPVAAHLARGVQLEALGSPNDTIQTIPFPVPTISRDADGSMIAAHGQVIHVDKFGNLISSLRAADLPERPVVTIAGRTIAGLSPHFQADEGTALVALVGSAGLLEVAVPNGNAAKTLGAGIGTNVYVARAESLLTPGS